MGKPTGRHRKPVRGRGQRLRWWFGVMLTAVLCSPLKARYEREPALHQGVSGAQVAGVSERGPKVSVERGSSTALPPSRSAAASVRIPSPREPHPSEVGWCVDDDGVRGVRPYLFRARSASALRYGKPSEVISGRPESEFGDLAFLVRTWLNMQNTT